MSDYPTITPKQRTANKDFIGSNCKLFFPLDEGSGDIITDLATGVVFDKTGSVFTTPHTIKNNWGVTNRIDSETIPAPQEGQHLLAFVQGTIFLDRSGFSFSIGAATDTGSASFLLSGGAISFTYRLTTLTTLTVSVNLGAALNVGDTIGLAGLFNVDTGVLTAYISINGSAFSLFGTATDATLTQYTSNITNVLTYGSFAQENFGAGYFHLDAIPETADLLAMLEVTRKNLIAGHKWYDPRLSNY